MANDIDIFVVFVGARERHFPPLRHGRFNDGSLESVFFLSCFFLLVVEMRDLCVVLLLWFCFCC